MNWNNKVVWSEGMFLRPQHFQQHERYIEHLVHNRSDGLRAYDYGFKSLKLDTELLALGQVAIVSAEGVLPDGTPFRIPEDAAPPPPLDLSQEVQGQDVVFTLPARRVGAGDVVLDQEREGATRFVPTRIAAHDSTRRDSISAEIDVAEPHFRLMLREQNLDGYVAMRLARISEITAHGGLIMDEDYLPPVLNCCSFPKLKANITDIHGRLSQRGNTLAASLGELGRSTAVELWEFMLLQVINRYESILKHLATLPTLHPEALYQVLVQLAGELAMLTRECRRPAALPEYRHDALAESFAPLMDEIRRAFSHEVEPNAIWIDLEDRGHFLHRGCPADPGLLAEADLVFAIKADMAPSDVMSRIKEIKFVSEEKLGTISGLAGIELHPLTVKPKDVPHHAGFMYFQLYRHGNPLQQEIWSQIQAANSFWIYDSGRFPGLQMEFWAIRP